MNTNKKTCNKCNKEKDLTEFYSNNRNKDKKDNYCKECRKEYSKTYSKTSRGIEVRIKAQTKYSKTEKGKERIKKYYKTENGKKAHYKSCKKANRKRRAIEHNVFSVSYTDESLIQYWKETGIDPEVCFHCKTKPFEQIDHFFPISKGGWDVPSNLVPSCKSCNCSKKDKLPTHFILERYAMNEKTMEPSEKQNK